MKQIRHKRKTGILLLTAILLMGCEQIPQEDAAQEEIIQEEIIQKEETETEEIRTDAIQMPQKVESKENTYDTLNVATYLTQIGDTYYLADCYHNQILYHDNLTDAISQWQVLTDEVHYAHTIAGDGTVLVIDDTENNRLLVFQKTEQGYLYTQTIEQVGMKPHFVQYHEERKVFLAWSSITGELYYLVRDQQTNQLVIDKILSLPQLYGIYVRSFTVIGDSIYFVSGHNNATIIKADLDTLEIQEEYPVTPEIAGMVQLVQIEEYYYLTISTDYQENQDYATIIRTKDLKTLQKGEYEDIYDRFTTQKGTPYYITQIEDTYYMTHHRTSENLFSFQVQNNEIINVEVLY